MGELEQSIMNTLWQAAMPLTSNEVRDRIGQQQKSTPAVTTVLTVLGRLHKKGFVIKNDSHRPHKFSATMTREEHSVQLLNDVLGSAVDKHAVLASFIGSIDPADAAKVQQMLNSKKK